MNKYAPQKGDPNEMIPHNPKTSRLSRFHEKPLAERQSIVANFAELDQSDQEALTTGLSLEQAAGMIENVIGGYRLPLGVATNFLINGREVLIPMVIEEPSVVAACSFAAKLVRDGGGFTTSSDEPIMIGQIQVLDVENVYAAAGKVWEHRDELIALANDLTSSIVRRGGGVLEIELRPFPATGHAQMPSMLVIHLLMDTRDAMGANAVNSVCESLAPRIEQITGGRTHLRILSNLTDRRKARASCTIPASALNYTNATGTAILGQEVVKGVVEASLFAELDPYRAATHNKGAMNGIDAVCLATGNDWRALEAGAHAYAARQGGYTSLTRWRATETGDLHGEIELPLAVGTVGGATRVHPGAGVALKILGSPDSRTLAEIMAAVGLAQNFAAIRALATDGIQRGHMAMHARQVAMAAGAPAHLVQQIADRLIQEHQIRVERAKTLLSELIGEGPHE
jgi:hydroxymethylglutaryl-CoA reductase